MEAGHKKKEPSVTQSKDSRTAILRAALRTFACDGYDGASLPKIARAAEVAPPLIYYHFGSKENLWRDTVDFSLGQLLRQVTAISDATRSLMALDRLRSMLEMFCLFAAEFPDQFSMIIAEARSDSDRFGWVNETYTSELFGLITATLEEAQKAGIVRNLNVENLATMLFGAIFTRFAVGRNQQQGENNRQVSEDYVVELFDAFINGIVVR